MLRGNAFFHAGEGDQTALPLAASSHPKTLDYKRIMPSVFQQAFVLNSVFLWRF